MCSLQPNAFAIRSCRPIWLAVRSYIIVVDVVILLVGFVRFVVILILMWFNGAGCFITLGSEYVLMRVVVGRVVAKTDNRTVVVQRVAFYHHGSI